MARMSSVVLRITGGVTDWISNTDVNRPDSKSEDFWPKDSIPQTNTGHSYNESQRDALFLKFIWQITLHVSDMSTLHHQEYLDTVYTQ